MPTRSEPNRELMLTSPYQVSHANRPPLRVGLLLDTKVLPRWLAEILAQIRDSSFARLELVVLNAEPGVEADPSSTGAGLARIVAALRRRASRRTLLFRLYERWDQARPGEFEDPLAPVDCSNQLRDVKTIAVEPERKRFVHRFPPDAVARIRDDNLDVLLRAGFSILRGEILQAARFGVWSYHHGDNEHYRGGPAGFWEVYEGNPLSGAMLQVLTEDLDAGTVLCKCLVATHPGLSRALNRPAPYWAAKNFVIQKLRELHERGWDFVQSRIVPPRPYTGRKRVYTSPTNWEMVRWLVPAVAGKVAGRITRRRRTRHWRLAMRRGADSLIDQGDTANLQGFRGIESPAGHFYADPFLMEHGGRTWLFFEDFDYGPNRGQISAAEVGDHDGVGETVPVLARPYHLSYPCVFRDGSDVLMIPETAGNDTVELYRCRRFPDRWTREKELFRGRAVDTTVWVEDGLYWFFVTLVEPRANFQELRLYFAESLTGAWTAHPTNPISTDVRTNRGAGALFRHHGRLIRPSQNGSGRYGRSLRFNEIVALTPERYEERPGITINPMKGFVGTHTYSRIRRIEIVDTCALVPEATLLRKRRGCPFAAPFTRPHDSDNP